MRYTYIMKKLSRQQLEKNYWQTAATHPDVEAKYICDIGDHERLKALGKMDGRVLEIGCGIGRLLKPHWFGVDISQRMINLAKNLKPICNYAVNDGRSLPYEDDYFDHIYCVLVFQHIPFDGFVQYVQEVKRTLRDEGTFRFQFIQGKEEGDFSHHYNLKEVRKTLKDAGFTVTLYKTGLGHEQWTWIHATKGVFEVVEETNPEKKEEKNG